MQAQRNQGPWTHRFLTYLFTVLLGFLFYWLIGFVINDMDRVRAPSFAELEAEMLDGSIANNQQRLTIELEEVKRQMATDQQRQALLRNSTENSQTTMNQLLDLQRLYLQKDVTPSDEERLALTESEQQFLENQRQYQQLNERLSNLHEQQRDLESQIRTLATQLQVAREPVQARFVKLHERHRLRVAAYKLAFLAPLILIAAIGYLKFRAGTYWAIVYAFGAAVMLKVGFVMHEYFPREYFKYILILTSLAAALRVLIYLLRLVAKPNQDWLVKQYREAYEAFLCPLCTHPIRRGPLKFMSWNRRTILRFNHVIEAPSKDEQPYTCPACSTQLYESCKACGAIRHSLLPACESCGDVVPVADPAVRGD